MIRLNRVLQIVHSLSIAGPEVLVTKFANGMRSRYETAICCLDRAGPLEGSAALAGIPIYNLNRRPGIDLHVIKKLKSIFSEYAPQIVHAHGYTAFFYAALSKKIGMKLLYTEHGRHYPDIVHYRRRLLNQWLKYRADWIGAVCQFSKERLIKNDWFWGVPVEVVYNGVPLCVSALDSHAELKHKLGVPRSAKVIGYVGGLRAIKNPFLLLDAFSKVIRNYENIYLLYIGDGELRLPLAEFSKKIGIDKKVIFCGAQHPVYPYLKILDLFILPSLSEAASIALLEAMEARVPVVVTDVGGNSEIVRHNISGVVVPSNDPVAMAQAILKFINHPDLYARMATIAHEEVRTKYSEEKMINSYMEIYKGYCPS